MGTDVLEWGLDCFGWLGTDVHCAIYSALFHLFLQAHLFLCLRFLPPLLPVNAPSTGAK